MDCREDKVNQSMNEASVLSEAGGQISGRLVGWLLNVPATW